MLIQVLLLPSVMVVTPVEGAAEVHNTRCPVTGFDVSNRRIYRWVMVRGRKYYVFDRRAAVLLSRNPEGYLDANGVPFNAHAKPGEAHMPTWL